MYCHGLIIEQKIVLSHDFKSEIGAPKQPGLELLYIVIDEQCVIEKVAESVRVIYDNRSACHQEVIY